MVFVCDRLVNGPAPQVPYRDGRFQSRMRRHRNRLRHRRGYVTRLLNQAAMSPCDLEVVRTDNEPEFTSCALIGWAQTHGIRYILIQPGRPMQNGYIESFDGKFIIERAHSLS